MTRLPTLGQRGEGWVVLQFLLVGIVVVLGFAGGGAWTREARYATTVAAAFLLLGGGLLVVRGTADLRDALTPLPRPREDAQLVETGVYGLVRHPIYGGIVIGSTGWALLTASPPALVGALALLVFFRLKAAREEAWLLERYPGYGAYRHRTRRMIPFLY